MSFQQGFNMFEQFTSNGVNVVTREVSLTEGKRQKHTILFGEETKLEYFELDEEITIKGVKRCDYVVVNHTQKTILFCELKNAKDKNQAVMQLKHSQYLVDCFCKILEQGNDYKKRYVIFNKKVFDKRALKGKAKIRRKRCQDFYYSYTGKTTVNWGDLCVG